jgi:dsDNA-binding SOS-regulon protein
MSIKIEYIVCNNKGEELKRFDAKSEAEAYDSVICAAEDLCELLAPLQKELSLSEEQLFAISEHLAFKSDEVKLALKQIKKPRSLSPESTTKNVDKVIIEEDQQPPASEKKNSNKKVNV